MASEDKRSTNGIILICVLIVMAGVGYGTWQRRHIDQTITAVQKDVADLYTKLGVTRE